MSLILRVGTAVALAVALAGWTTERLRFGSSDADALSRVQTELQQRFARGADALGQIASTLARQADVIRAAPRDTAKVRQLFEATAAALQTSETNPTGVTIYDGSGAPIAWAGRVSDVSKARLDEPASLFVALGAPGPRLLRVEPIVDTLTPGAPRLATVVAEETFGTLEATPTIAATFVVPTSIVPVTLRPGTDGGSDAPYTFAITVSSGGVLADAVVSPDALTDSRDRWRRRTWAATLAVFALTALFAAGPLTERRRRTHAPSGYVAVTVALATIVLIARVLFSAAAGLVMTNETGLSSVDLLLSGLSLSAIVWLGIDLIERRRFVRPSPRLLPATSAAVAATVAGFFAIGALNVWILLQYSSVLAGIVRSTSLDLIHFSHYPVSASRVALAFGLVLLHASVIWAAAAMLRVPGVIWRTPRSIGRRTVALAWTTSALASALWVSSTGRSLVPLGPLLLALAAIGICAWSLSRLRARMRRVSQAAQLAAGFLVLAVPAVVLYPSLVALATEDKERIVADTYAPQALSQRQELKDRLHRSLDEIDALPSLASHRAFDVWSATDLAAYRLTSVIELYGPDGRLTSRFALNLPEATAGRFRAAGCEWDEFDEESPFGSTSRHVLRASRGLCDRGRLLGAIVVRAMLDYRTLPFIASQSPYLESLRPDISTEDSGHDMEFVVYGWSRAPLFSYGTSVWSLPDDVFGRMVESRTALWARVERDAVPFRVYFFSDRGGIYALGYPITTWFGHTINIVEVITITMALYVLVLVGGTILNAMTSRTPTSGRALLREVRSSFYRKLFLYFVLGAVVPVVVLALAIRTYFAAQLRAGIDEAAARTASVAERLVEDYATLQPGASGALGAIDDQIMVLVGQAIDQDVNLFDRGRLQATTERDLFETGLLSTRTPADVYRRILLDRLPTYVGVEEVAGYPYRLAAAPVRAGGREGIVSVPLTLRQQEIEQQIDELDHRVVFAAVLFSVLGAAIGYWMAERIADPVNRLTRATRRIARGDLDARIASTSSDELRRLVDDFNQMAADLKRQRSELERTQRLEAWAEMARQVAHDIKNPLTPIQLSAEHARRVNRDKGAPLSPALDDCVNTILNQVRLLRAIASEFSSFASSPTANPETTSLVALLNEVVDPYRTGLAGRIRITIDAPDDLPPVNIDRTLFARALTNIIENALHAMPGAGDLTIVVRLKPDITTPTPAVSIPKAETARTIEVAITDTGVGMDDAALAKIFEPYFSTKATGTGLGLTIAKRNVELNGGRIEVTSARGAGTTVRIELPV